MFKRTFGSKRLWAARFRGFLPPTLLAWTAAAVFVPLALDAQIDVLTNRYDGAQQGRTSSETTLTVANVNVNQFGKLYSYPVDGAVYAQPLYVRGVTIQGTPRNVLYVATMNDKVYAFDADSASPSPLWMTDFTNPPSVTPVPITDIVTPSTTSSATSASRARRSSIARRHAVSGGADQGERQLRPAASRAGHRDRAARAGKSRRRSPASVPVGAGLDGRRRRPGGHVQPEDAAAARRRSR